MLKMRSVVYMATGGHPELCGRQSYQDQALIAHHTIKRRMAAFNLGFVSRRCLRLVGIDQHRFAEAAVHDSNPPPGKISRKNTRTRKSKNERKSKRTRHANTERRSINKTKHVMCIGVQLQEQDTCEAHVQQQEQGQQH